MQLKETIEAYVEEFISEEEGLFIVEISISGKTVGQKVQIVMDGDEGITIDQCASISRRLAARIEAEELIEDKYLLEVTSAGVESPMKLERQYVKNIGRTLKVTLAEKVVVEGKLVAFESGIVKLEVGDQTQDIALKEIEKSVIVVSFK